MKACEKRETYKRNLRKKTLGVAMEDYLQTEHDGRNDGR